MRCAAACASAVQPAAGVKISARGGGSRQGAQAGGGGRGCAVAGGWPEGGATKGGRKEGRRRREDESTQALEARRGAGGGRPQRAQRPENRSSEALEAELRARSAGGGDVRGWLRRCGGREHARAAHDRTTTGRQGAARATAER